jgi:hypothetical protein
MHHFIFVKVYDVARRVKKNSLSPQQRASFSGLPLWLSCSSHISVNGSRKYFLSDIDPPALSHYTIFFNVD